MPHIATFRRLAFTMLIAPAVTFAQPSVTVDSVTLDSDGVGVTTDTYNGEAAVCLGNKATGLDVSATFSPLFTTPSTTPGSKEGCNNATGSCTQFPAGGGHICSMPGSKWKQV